jgi:dihydrofolate reductase
LHDALVITVIVAMSRNRVIGRRGALPWRLPADLARFKQRTLGHAVIMGRRTWDTLNGRPLSQRTNIVLTRDPRLRLPEGVRAAASLEQALELARRSHPGSDEIFVAGGAEIYRAALPIAQRIDMTWIDVEISDGDAFFPPFEQDASWRLTQEAAHPADERHAWPFHFRTYERARSGRGE